MKKIIILLLFITFTNYAHAVNWRAGLEAAAKSTSESLGRKIELDRQKELMRYQNELEMQRMRQQMELENQRQRQSILLERERMEKEYQRKLVEQEKELNKNEQESPTEKWSSTEDLERENRRIASVINKHVAIISNQIRQNWIRPTGSSDELVTKIHVILMSGGEVKSVNIVKSSGNRIFDYSVENAIYKVGSLSLPKEPAISEKMRDIQFHFKAK